MASLFAHAALPLIARRAVPSPAQGRRLTTLAVICACLPDLDLVGLAFGVPASSPWSHRGFSHSLLAAACIALAAAILGLRALKIGSRPWWVAALFLFASTGAHGLVDAMTVGDVGVALFAPFETGRHFLPLRLLPVCPLGVPEYLGRWGALVVLNEATYLVLPALLLRSIIRALRAHGTDRQVALSKWVVAVLAWAGVTAALRHSLPDEFTLSRPRELEALGAPGSDEDAASIPSDGLPSGALVTRFDELTARGLFERELHPAREPWSSGFFPSWYGGPAGRWQQARPRLVWRTLFGASPPSAQDAHRWLETAAAGDAAASRLLFTLSPTEKIDLARGDDSFAVSRRLLSTTHNGHPRFWFGYCNGVAAAAMFQPEPYREVEVIRRDGYRIRFHPNDVKALLALSYYWTRDMFLLGGECRVVSFDSGRVCSMNPALLVLAVLNRIGLARQTFLIDVIPTPQAQYYAVSSARVHVLRPPYSAQGVPAEARLAPELASLVDVQVDFELSSTTLSDAVADRRAVGGDPTRYERVGVRPVPFSFRATLGLSRSGELIGGRWNGDPPDGPDAIGFVTRQPMTVSDGGTALERAPELEWPLVQAIAHASVDPSDAVPVLDLRETPAPSSGATSIEEDSGRRVAGEHDQEQGLEPDSQ